MRKQTKLVAVVSAAALLAIGASMTSFAATGWVEEGGEWFFYEKDGSKAEDAWKKSGDKWFWLNSEESGAMAIDKLIDDGDNTYYVDSTGAMVANTWVKIVNEEQDDDDDNPAEYNYYYMQNNGKAYKAGDNSSTKFRTIDGKRYAFDEDGKMLYGWVDENGSKLNGEDEWGGATYYLGNWDEGWMKTGWQKIYVHDADEDEDMEHWFNFKSNGKKRFNDKSDQEFAESKINGKKYGFDERGVMVYEWTLATNTPSGPIATGSDTHAGQWRYFNSPEDGARATKGWFKVVAPSEDNTFGSINNTFDKSKADDESEKWYYADGDGKLKAGEVAKIKGKYYAFAETGYMLNGLVFMTVDEEGNIENIYDDGVASDDLDDIMDGKSGGAEGKGKGVSGIEGGKYIYKYGKKLKAGNDDKYKVVGVLGSADTGSGLAGAGVVEVPSSDLRKEATDLYKNKDGDTVRFSLYYESPDVYLINTTGTIVKSKTAAKDGDDRYFFVQDKQIRMYANNKSLSLKKDEKGNNVNGTLDLSDWKNFDYTKPEDKDDTAETTKTISAEMGSIDFE